MTVWFAAAAAVLSACQAPPTGSGSSPVPAGSSTTAGTAPTAPSAPDLTGAGLPPGSAPGAVSSAVTQATVHSTICVSGYTASVRPPASYTDALKRQQMASEGLPGPTSLYEEDHRVPLEVGGNPTSPLNLWPEPWDGPHGAHAKDAIENRVHRDVCNGTLTLAQGQAVFLGDWWTAVVP